MAISVDADVRITVLGTTVMALDARQRIIRGIQNQADIAAVIHKTMVANADIVVPVHHPLDLAEDTRQAVSVRFDRSADAAGSCTRWTVMPPRDRPSTRC